MQDDDLIQVQRESGWYFTVVENAIIDDETLDAYDKSVFLALSRFENKSTKTCYPSLAKISQKAGCSVSSVRRSLKKLHAKGYVGIGNRTDESSGTLSNVYEIKSQYVIQPATLCSDRTPPPVPTEQPPCSGGIAPLFPQNNELRERELRDKELYISRSGTGEEKPPDDKSGKRKKKSVEDADKVKFAENVRMEQKEYDTLCQQYGESATKRMIEILDDYKGAHGRGYKSDYRAIRMWVVKKYQEEQSPRGSLNRQFHNAKPVGEGWRVL